MMHKRDKLFSKLIIANEHLLFSQFEGVHWGDDFERFLNQFKKQFEL
jgi:hypothetical protein